MHLIYDLMVHKIASPGNIFNSLPGYWAQPKNNIPLPLKSLSYHRKVTFSGNDLSIIRFHFNPIKKDTGI